MAWFHGDTVLSTEILLDRFWDGLGPGLEGLKVRARGRLCRSFGSGPHGVGTSAQDDRQKAGKSKGKGKSVICQL